LRRSLPASKPRSASPVGHCFLGNCGESVARQAKFLETLREYKVEGVLLMPAIGTRKATVLQMREWGIPLVMVSRYVAGVDTDYAGSDNRLGSMLATEHLLSLGHERIAFIGANRRTSTGRDRTAGFHRALKTAAIPLAAELVVECNASREDGFRAIVALFRRKRPPTAVVCFNDLLAFGAMLGLRRLGLEPGYDCSVVGADDVTEAALWQPPLTAVAVDAVAIGRAARQLLRERIALPEKPAERVLQQPKLVIRASCGETSAHSGTNRKRYSRST